MAGKGKAGKPKQNGGGDEFETTEKSSSDSGRSSSSTLTICMAVLALGVGCSFAFRFMFDQMMIKNNELMSKLNSLELEMSNMKEVYGKLTVDDDLKNLEKLKEDLQAAKSQQEINQVGIEALASAQKPLLEVPVKVDAQADEIEKINAHDVKVMAIVEAMQGNLETMKDAMSLTDTALNTLSQDVGTVGKKLVATEDTLSMIHSSLDEVSKEAKHLGKVGSANEAKLTELKEVVSASETNMAGMTQLAVGTGKRLAEAEGKLKDVEGSVQQLSAEAKRLDGVGSANAEKVASTLQTVNEMNMKIEEVSASAAANKQDLQNLAQQAASGAAGQDAAVTEKIAALGEKLEVEINVLDQHVKGAKKLAEESQLAAKYAAQAAKSEIGDEIKDMHTHISLVQAKHSEMEHAQSKIAQDFATLSSASVQAQDVDQLKEQVGNLATSVSLAQADTDKLSKSVHEAIESLEKKSNTLNAHVKMVKNEVQGIRELVTTVVANSEESTPEPAAAPAVVDQEPAAAAEQLADGGSE